MKTAATALEVAREEEMRSRIRTPETKLWAAWRLNAADNRGALTPQLAITADAAPGTLTFGQYAIRAEALVSATVASASKAEAAWKAAVQRYDEIVVKRKELRSEIYKKLLNMEAEVHECRITAADAVKDAHLWWSREQKSHEHEVQSMWMARVRVAEEESCKLMALLDRANADLELERGAKEWLLAHLAKRPQELEEDQEEL